MSYPFRFKQFSINHDRCTMKVGTDAVLLGALTETGNAANILDIGTSSGIIAIMLAQKSDAFITGIDIDADSIVQANENAAASPWSERLNFIHTSVQEYAIKHPQSADLIVCNPPFFVGSLKSQYTERNLARHDVFLSFSELLTATQMILKEDGRAYFIYPYRSVDEFTSLATASGLSLFSRCSILPKPGKEINRCIDGWQKAAHCEVVQQNLCVYNENNEHTEEYRECCKDYYLSF